MPTFVSARIFHVAYNPELLALRTELLLKDGYEVTPALGNDQAIGLAASSDFDLAVIGFSGPHSTRNEIIRWLKRHYPEKPVVVLLSSDVEHFPDADCKTLSEDPRIWLTAVRSTIPS